MDRFRKTPVTLAFTVKLICVQLLYDIIRLDRYKIFLQYPERMVSLGQISPGGQI